MSSFAVLLPVFVLLAMTFALLVWTGAARVGAIRRQELHIREIALDRNNWPKRIKQIGNAFQNQLELPVLFYILVALVLATGEATVTFVALSWVFVAARVGHAAILVTHNNVPRRFYAYNAGLIVLIVLWIWFLAALVSGT